MSGLGRKIEYIIAEVAVNHPHGGLYDYLCPIDFNVSIGQLVLVPFRLRKSIGLVWNLKETSDLDFLRLKSIEEVCLSWSPLSIDWLNLTRFAANYYQKSIGEVALPAIPKGLRLPGRWKERGNEKKIFFIKKKLDERGGGKATEGFTPPSFIRGKKQRELFHRIAFFPLSLASARKIHPNAKKIFEDWVEKDLISFSTRYFDEKNNISAFKKNLFEWPDSSYLRDEQIFAVDSIKKFEEFSCSLLFGITGSGKTEVYLHLVKDVLDRSNSSQVLILVPEINLTPQLLEQFLEKFGSYGEDAVVSMHSRISNSARSSNWLAVHEGHAKILIGTRLAALASFRNLKLIIVDEEHEVSYKQQEGLRYSARDLCVWRAKQLGIPIVLGSASPSLETWHRTQLGYYHRFDLKKRALVSFLPEILILDLKSKFNLLPLGSGSCLSQGLINAIGESLQKNEQCLLFLNRRGFAPLLACQACEWIAHCHHCSAYLVYHRADKCLRCHYCGDKLKIPFSCPQCNNTDLASIGTGTQRVEEELQIIFPGIKILRVDADSTRRVGAAEKIFKSIHDQEAQLIIGTNMIIKGHDFKNIGLVGILNIDAALFSHDFRSSERLFSQLIQVSGRAGRDKSGSKVIIQTRYPDHPLFALFVLGDYPQFAERMLSERREANLPPFINQAILRAEATSLEKAMDFLRIAASFFDEIQEMLGHSNNVTRCQPVPLTMMKLANRYRAQLLVESKSKKALQKSLTVWRKKIEQRKKELPAACSWVIEVDPLEL